jgi:hypothetical protein
MTENVNNNSSNILTRIFGGLAFFGRKARAEKKDLQNLSPQELAEKRWNQYVPFTMEQAAKILKQDLPPETTVQIDVTEPGQALFTIKAENIFSEMRSCNFHEHIAYRGSLEVSRYDRSKGLGRNLMRNEIELYRACGIDKLEIHAASEVGGYAWARMGFLPDKIKHDLKDDVQYRWKILADILTEEERAQLKKTDSKHSAIDMNAPKDIWQIADLKTDMAPRLRDLFAQAAKGDKRARSLVDTLQEHYESARVHTGKWGQQKFDLQQEIGASNALSLGKMLLIRTQWNGTLDFNNPEQMARVEKYVGGWKYPTTRSGQT